MSSPRQHTGPPWRRAPGRRHGRAPPQPCPADLRLVSVFPPLTVGRTTDSFAFKVPFYYLLCSCLLYLTFMFLSSPKDTFRCFERGRPVDAREQQRSVASHTRPDRESNLQTSGYRATEPRQGCLPIIFQPLLLSCFTLDLNLLWY